MMHELLEYVRVLESRIGALERQERSVPVVAIYQETAGQSIGTGGSDTVVNFATLVADTHGAVVTGAAWKFTAPLAGYYRISARVTFAATTAWAENERAQLRAYTNGSGNVVLDFRTGLDGAIGAQGMHAGGSCTIPLAAGDVVDVRVFQNSGGALALNGFGNFNYISIFRIH